MKLYIIWLFKIILNFYYTFKYYNLFRNPCTIHLNKSQLCNKEILLVNKKCFNLSKANHKVLLVLFPNLNYYHLKLHTKKANGREIYIVNNINYNKFISKLDNRIKAVRNFKNIGNVIHIDSSVYDCKFIK